MERKVLVCMVSLVLVTFCSTVMAVDTCQKLHDRYQICLEKEAAGRRMDYDYCTLVPQFPCGLEKCYWNSTTNTCQTDLTLSDSNFDGKVNLSDLVILKQEFLRQDGPTTPTGPPLDCNTSSAPVPKTGQTTSYATGDDGDLEKGVAWPNPRFTDNGDGTVTDNLTGLIWLKNANCYGTRLWNGALIDCNGLNTGECGLTDGSQAGDWRLPNYKELFSLVDAGNYSPALPSGHPFTNVQSYAYWSSTTYDYNPVDAWFVNMLDGDVNHLEKTYWTAYYFVWPVRGGQ